VSNLYKCSSLELIDFKVDGCEEACDDCGAMLLDVNYDGREEVYCAFCDVGDKVSSDGTGEVGRCDGCSVALATWFPFSLCPGCIVVRTCN
jgi:hypothetical protein